LARLVALAMLVSPLLRWYPMAVLRRTAATAGPLPVRALVGVFAQGDVADPVQPVLDVPLQPGPVLELIGLSVFGR
jgi:hypothetical protein